jgi:hypothetical protein
MVYTFAGTTAVFRKQYNLDPTNYDTHELDQKKTEM